MWFRVSGLGFGFGSGSGLGLSNLGLRLVVVLYHVCMQSMKVERLSASLPVIFYGLGQISSASGRCDNSRQAVQLCHKTITLLLAGD